MAFNEGTSTPDARQRESAGLRLSELVMGERSLLMHAAAIGGNYDAVRMSALATTLQRETAQERKRSSAPAATCTAVLPASAVHTT
eukprot:1753597-Pleurochrysis_carterae.AAC.1